MKSEQLSNRTYLVVFHGTKDGNKISDSGDDPCFNNPPSWGICRPTVRKYIKIGDTLVFLAKVDKEYFLKGWFKVGEKIDYLTALERFPSRKNVMLSKVKPDRKDFEWSNGKLKKKYTAKYGNSEPKFLLDLQSSEGTFYQSAQDTHKIDNWKCRRIFHCISSRLESCIESNNCSKNGKTLKNYNNYVVADHKNWANVDHLNVTLDEIRSATGFNASIRTPKNQHNVRRFDEFKDKLLDYLDKKGKGADS